MTADKKYIVGTPKTKNVIQKHSLFQKPVNITFEIPEAKHEKIFIYDMEPNILLCPTSI